MQIQQPASSAGQYEDDPADAGRTWLEDGFRWVRGTHNRKRLLMGHSGLHPPRLKKRYDPGVQSVILGKWLLQMSITYKPSAICKPAWMEAFETVLKSPFVSIAYKPSRPSEKMALKSETISPSVHRPRSSIGFAERRVIAQTVPAL